MVNALAFIISMLFGSSYAEAGIRLEGTQTTLPGEYKLLADIKISDLQVMHFVRVNDPKCSALGQSRHFIYLHGPINPDVPYVIERLLGEIWSDPNRCIGKSGYPALQEVYIQSEGGYYRDGIELGKIFRKYNIATNIADNGGGCYSACAMAFLGGMKRYMGSDSWLGFHAPYRNTSSGIVCQRDNKELKNFVLDMLGKKHGDHFYERLMSHCGTREVWLLNADAARFFNIIW